MTIILLLVSLGIILLSAEIFTNGVEWLGKKLNLSEGAVGSVLAAVGTALPETMIPVIAILFSSSHSGAEIGIGAILGAPFMLATLAMALTGVAALVFKHQGKKREKMLIDANVMSRDLGYFIPAYTLAIGAAFVSSPTLKLLIAISLVAFYVYYVYKTITSGKKLQAGHLNPLYFDRKNSNPSTPVVLIQVLVALAGIITGAHLFVDGVERLAEMLGISAFILSIIIAPIATELPEKFNSIIWVKKGKDTLALGNITGAMVFQSSLVPALGIAMTPWQLSPLALISAVLALTAATIVYIGLKTRKSITPQTLLMNGCLYGIFIVAVLLLGN